jgi:hypothetical protein
VHVAGRVGVFGDHYLGQGDQAVFYFFSFHGVVLL